MIDPPVLLFAFANYYQPSRYLRNLPEERKQIEAALSQAEEDGLCKLVVLPNASLQEIIEAFRKYAGRIVLFHFGGHADMYTLHLETPYRTQDRLHMKSFANFLAEQKGLHLVFLNGCSTGPQNKQLIDKGIPAVIATENAISDAVAVEFATQFYESFNVGKSINQAYKEAVAIIKSQKKYQDTRALYRPEQDKETNEQPWKLHHDTSAVNALDWNLPEVAGQPLYGLIPTPEIPMPGNPYLEQGLRPYLHSEYPVFWGRDKKIRQCFDYLTKEGGGLVFVYGIDGIGKTSFLNAGLLPYLKKEHTIAYYDHKDPAFSAEKLQAGQIQAQIIVLDDPPDKLRDEVLQILGRQSNHQFVIALSTSKLEYWLEGTKERAYRVKRFFLAPLEVSAIRDIMMGGSKEALRLEYKARLDTDLVTRLSVSLSEDSTACLPPLLQYAMQKLWRAATHKSLEQPVLSWELYQKLVQEGLWSQFMEEQLGTLDEAYQQSGLALNVLAAFLQAGPEKNYTLLVEEVLNQFQDGKNQVQVVLKQLLRQRLLCQPAEDNFETSHLLRLSHQILERPLYQLLNQSQQPGQELQRVLLHHHQHGSYLTAKQLEQWQAFRWAVSTPEPEIQSLINESQIKRRDEKSKLQRRRVLNFTGMLLVLACGVNMPNPYLLLLALLLYTAYHGAKAMAEKIQ